MFGAFYDNPVDADRLIERFSLEEKANSPFDSLSGGQKQRLALALAFVNDPQVLFLDEPTTGLDPQSRRELHGSIEAMKRDGRTVLLTTHYIEEAHRLCDRIAIIDHGRIIATGSPDELIAGAKATPAIVLQTTRTIDGELLRSLPGIQGLEWTLDRGELKTASISRTMIELVKLLDAQKIELVDLHIHKPSLEDVFIELTGTSLRD